MENVTLDAIIRRYLALNRLPLHYYVPMLVIAKQGLEEMHFDTLQKVKHVVIPVSAGFEAPLPSDYVEAVAVAAEIGDKIKQIGYDRTLNVRDNDGDAFEESADQYYSGVSLNSTGLFIENYFNEYGAYNGKLFGRNVTWTDSYTINRDLGIIRVNNKSDITAIHLVYLSLPEKVNNKSLIHPFAQRALIEFINWQKSRYFKEGNVMKYNEQQFYNEYRKLRARLNKLSTVEIKRAVRRHVNLAIKG
jgi:hypothetical protein